MDIQSSSEADNITVSDDDFGRAGRVKASLDYGNYTTSMTMTRGEAARLRDALDAYLTPACTCTPAIAGISDGPSIDCPVHGEAAVGVDEAVRVALSASDDRNHDDLCACAQWPTGCVTYGSLRPWSHDAELVARDALEAAGHR